MENWSLRDHRRRQKRFVCSSRHFKMLQELNLTTCQLCVCYFDLCFPLLLFTKRILSIYNGLPRRTLALCLSVKPKCFCSEKHPELVHLQEKRNLYISFLRALEGIIAKPGAFLLYSSSAPDPNEMLILRQSAIWSFCQLLESSPYSLSQHLLSQF